MDEKTSEVCTECTKLIMSVAKDRLAAIGINEYPSSDNEDKRTTGDNFKPLSDINLAYPNLNSGEILVQLNRKLFNFSSADS